MKKVLLNKRSSRKVAVLLAFVMVAVLMFSGCSYIQSQVNFLKGRLIGVSYNAEFYDNHGAKFMELSGKNIDIDGNIVDKM
mgnify:FL=1